MKKMREHSKMVVIIMLTIGIVIESSAVSSGEMFGQFGSSAAVDNRINASNKVEMAAFPALLLAAAEVIGAAYAAGYVLGRLAYAAVGQANLIDNDKDKNYERLAFSQFDN